MTLALIASSIANCEITLPEEVAQGRVYFQIELSSKDTGVFDALYGRLVELSEHVSVNFSRAGDGYSPLDAGGVAIFYYESEEQARILSRNFDIIKEAIESTMVGSAIDSEEPLQLLMDARDFGGAYAHRVYEVNKINEESALSRAQEMMDSKCEDEDDYDAIMEHNLTLLSDDDYTLNAEIDAIFETIKVCFDGIDDANMFANAVTAVFDMAQAVDDEFRSERIIEEHVTLYTDSALEMVIDEITFEDQETAMAAYRLEKKGDDLVSNRNRSNVIRGSWQNNKASLGAELQKILKGVERNNAPVSFSGVDIGCTLSQSFSERLKESTFSRTIREYESHQAGALASAIVAQVGAFIELKRGQMLKDKRHQLTKDLIAQYKSQGKLCRVAVYQKVLDDTASVFENPLYLSC